ncbi:type I phosphomannose isomerase catalytic subunit [Geojedonia litorea]|uniref:Phosphohexomutase n=1 Tax=Geojedonia litorea TaxID=1268269 RepID=A0ABV9N2S9_9FLAO
MTDSLYPFKFHPILKERIWGGQKLKNYLNKNSQSTKVGESWEISDVEGDTSIISNGKFKGQSLKQILLDQKEKLIGHKNHQVFGDKFPLLIKFIDAREDLSIQLHPNDQLAAKRHNSFGKTEMWYVMQADAGSNLIVGFNQQVTPELYLKHLNDKTLTQILNFDEVKAGDTYFIEVGRVHAIGAGVLLAEIQQTSDITYRIYDWDRVDDQGNERELHNDLAIDAIDFEMKNDFKVQYETVKNKPNQMVRCNYFTTNYLNLDGLFKRDNHHDSFMIYICTEGEATIHCSNSLTTLKKGETVLIPAGIKSFEISAENVTLLEVYV